MKRALILLLVILGVLILLILVFIPFGFHREGSGESSSISVIAHRGASGHAPENTLPAVDLALISGADYIEIDVHLTKDNHVVVIHDATVDRTTYGQGKVADLTLETILSLEAGEKFDISYKGTRIPLLEEVIEHVNGRSRLLIEIKKKRGQYIGIESKVIDLIRKHNATGWCEVQSFNDEVLDIIHSQAPDIILHKLLVFKFRFLPYLFDGTINRYSREKYHYIHSFNMYKKTVNKGFARELKKDAKEIFLWGFSKVDPCMELRSDLWDGIITDWPAEYRSIIEAKPE